MKKKYNDMNPVVIAVGSVMITVAGSIYSDFGLKEITYHRYRSSPLAGIFLIISILIISIFNKEYREKLWTIKGLIIITIAFLIDLPFVIIYLSNRYGL